jgi:hypothetical protein
MSDPLTIRIGDRKTSIRRSHPILAEVEARGDNLAAVIVRDLERYYALLAYETSIYNRGVDQHLAMQFFAQLARIDSSHRLDWIDEELMDCDITRGRAHSAATLDALERAHRLVEQGASVDDALVQVGLVANESANSTTDTC